MSFGSRLSEIRIKSGVSQEELSEKLGVSVQTVHRWEHDKSAPNIHQLKTLCEVFSVSSSYFFEEAEQNEPVIAEETEEYNETAIAEKAVVEEAPLETPAPGRVEKAPQPTMLFANKWYYWVALIPWFILFFHSFSIEWGVVFFFASCLVWAAFTAGQELCYRSKIRRAERVQILLSVIKTVFIMACALYFAWVMIDLLWKIIFIFIACMCVVGCVLEAFIIKDSYQNRS